MKAILLIAVAFAKVTQHTTQKQLMVTTFNNFNRLAQTNLLILDL